MVKMLLDDPRLAKHKDFISGYTALHWAAKHGESRDEFFYQLENFEKQINAMIFLKSRHENEIFMLPYGHFKLIKYCLPPL